jgi:uncharacterized protein (DUF1330 family)
LQGRGAMMPAYIISDVAIRDAAAIETYRTRAAASIFARRSISRARRGV